MNQKLANIISSLAKMQSEKTAAEKQATLALLRQINRGLRLPVLKAPRNVRNISADGGMRELLRASPATFVPGAPQVRGSASLLSPQLIEEHANLASRLRIPEGGAMVKVRGNMPAVIQRVSGQPGGTYTPRQREYLSRLVNVHEGELEARSMREIGGFGSKFDGHLSPQVVMRESNLVSRGGDDARMVRDLLGRRRSQGAEAGFIQKHAPGWTYGARLPRAMRNHIEKQWASKGQQFQKEWQQGAHPFEQEWTQGARPQFGRITERIVSPAEAAKMFSGARVPGTPVINRLNLGARKFPGLTVPPGRPPLGLTKTFKKARALLEEKLAEVKLDINKGDVLLGGKYKNSPITVEETGTDELGQPTVNGKKLLAFRIKKLMPAKTAAEKLAKFIIAKGPDTAAAYLEGLRLLLDAKETKIPAKTLAKVKALKKPRRYRSKAYLEKFYGRALGD